MAETNESNSRSDEDHKMGAQECEDGAEYDHDDEYGEEEDELYDDDDDANQEAEEMAKRLGDALWADINKALAATTAQQQNNAEPSGETLGDDGVDEETLVDAVQEVIDLTEAHLEMLQKLSETAVPNSEDNLYDALNDILHSRQVSAEQAGVLGDLVESILRGDFFQ